MPHRQMVKERREAQVARIDRLLTTLDLSPTERTELEQIKAGFTALLRED